MPKSVASSRGYRPTTETTTMQYTGAELIIRLLERQGIRTIAGIPGGANLPLYDALARHPVIEHVLARHEQGAGFIAQGMARVSGQPAVCFATSGPGATNILTAIADAKLDSVPLVCISGQVARPLIGTDAFQEVDVFGMSLPITKHNYLVEEPQDLLRIIPEAFRIASSGRPGPVWIDVPKDVQLALIEFDDLPEPGRPDVKPTPNSEDITAAIMMIESSERPILYLGGGIIHSGASTLACTLAERSDLPTVQSLMALGAIPSDHPQALGMLGMHAAPYTNLALEACDLLIAIGARFDDRATGKVAEFCPQAKVLHIDIDPSELNKIRQTTHSIPGDACVCIEAILQQLASRKRPSWQAEIAQLKMDHPMHMPGLNDPSKHYGLIRTIAEIAGRDCILTTDVGQHQMWTAQSFPFNRPRQWLTSGGLGTMGFGLPAAIGAALTQPEATVVCISGDGSFLMNNQELITAAETGANVKIVLMNNQSLGMVQQQQNMFYGQRRIASRFQMNPDFPAMARAMGIRAIDLEGSDNIEADLAQAFAMNGPCLIHAPICSQQQVLPIVPPGQSNRNMIRHPEAPEACVSA